MKRDNSSDIASFEELQPNKKRKVSSSLRYLQSNAILRSTSNPKNQTTIVVISCELLEKQTPPEGNGRNHPNQEAEDFIDQVEKGLCQINKTKVGQLLLEDIAALNSKDLVIFSIKFPNLLNLLTDSNDAEKKHLLKKIPNTIRKLLGWDDISMAKNHISVLEIGSLLAGCSSSCFAPLATTQFAKNLIFIGQEKFKNFLCV